MVKNVKIISIGNIFMGGTGKTPHTIALAQEYITRGEKVAIISLGYKGGLGYGINVISDGEKILYRPPNASDEAYMMALNCPQAVVITGKRREEAALIAKEKFGCSMVILDDGFQYKTLKRDANILLLDHSNPISTGFPFPFGYLRESPKACSRADIIIFTRSQNHIIAEKVKKYIQDQPIFFSHTIMDKIVINNKTYLASECTTKSWAAFSAIASNFSFKNSLIKLGLTPLYFKSFLDHTFLKEKIIDKIIKNGEKNGAKFFITTEKDYVKLTPKHQKIFAYLKMEIEIDEKEKFFRCIDSLL